MQNKIEVVRALMPFKISDVINILSKSNFSPPAGSRLNPFITHTCTFIKQY